MRAIRGCVEYEGDLIAVKCSLPSSPERGPKFFAELPRCPSHAVDNRIELGHELRRAAPQHGG